MTEAERREFFRVNDDVRISYRCLDDRGAEQLARVIKSGLPSAFQLRSQLDATDRELAEARKGLVELPQALVHYLDLMEQRLQQLATITQLLTDNPETTAVCEVSLSGNGIALATEQQMVAGQAVELCMQLSGGAGAIHALAAVTSCRQQGQRYQTAMEFRLIDDEDRETIVRRTMARQAEQIRAAANEDDL
ncbi:MAG TPA: hypothetical protein DCF45_10955 [Gammaproteobacteria bacterium]|nr:hypothetical protein [Gammaproteobacteria bacterium]